MAQNQPQDIKQSVQAQFGPNAQNYVSSTVHATGDDLGIITAWAGVGPQSVALDVATGGGHMALQLAKHAGRVVATDITQPMLDAAQAFITPQVDNVTFQLADAEDLPFEDATFDAVTCRIAAHHFPDIYQFVTESVRVLKPGGRLVVRDYVMPADENDAAYVDAFEKLRDPSHARGLSDEAWRGTFLDARLTIENVTHYEDVELFVPFVARLNCPPDVVEKLTVMLAQAPENVKAYLKPTAIGTPEAAFTHHYIIIVGRKG